MARGGNSARIRIYFEGDPKLRKGFHDLFSRFYRSNISIQLVSCRANVVEDFMIAIQTHTDSVNILLIDSEGPYSQDPLATVKSHSNWNPNIGSAVKECQVHFMVQVMEAWFLSDRQALRSYYGQSFRENRLPGNTNVEQIPKDDVLNRLSDATQETQKGKYHKTRHAPELLAMIDSSKVCAASPACARLFDTMERLTAPSN